jgi:serine/threonine-protein kinase
MGTTLYMSPEQLHSAKDVDARTDIWALGVVLFELLTGRVPFEGETHVQIAVKISVQAPTSLGTYRPDAPAGLEAVILRCLEKRREQRYPNVAELALALLPFSPKRSKTTVERITGIIQSAGLSASALTVPLSPGGASRMETLAQASVGRSVLQAGVYSRRVWAWIAVGVFGTSMAAAAVFVAARYGAFRAVTHTPSAATGSAGAALEIKPLSPMGDGQPTPTASAPEGAPEATAQPAPSERLVPRSVQARVDAGVPATPPKRATAGVASAPASAPASTGAIATVSAATTSTPIAPRPPKPPAVVDPLYMPIQ